MSIGFVVRGADGQVTFDGTVRVGRILGSFLITVHSGSFTIPAGIIQSPAFAYSSPIYAKYGISNPAPGNDRLWIAGNTIYWQYFSLSHEIIYGECTQ